MTLIRYRAQGRIHFQPIFSSEYRTKIKFSSRRQGASPYVPDSDLYGSPRWKKLPELWTIRNRTYRRRTIDIDISRKLRKLRWDDITIPNQPNLTVHRSRKSSTPRHRTLMPLHSILREPTILPDSTDTILLHNHPSWDPTASDLDSIFSDNTCLFCNLPASECSCSDHSSPAVSDTRSRPSNPSPAPKKLGWSSSSSSHCTISDTSISDSTATNKQRYLAQKIHKRNTPSTRADSEIKRNRKFHTTTSETSVDLFTTSSSLSSTETSRQPKETIRPDICPSTTLPFVPAHTTIQYPSHITHTVHAGKCYVSINRKPPPPATPPAVPLTVPSRQTYFEDTDQSHNNPNTTWNEDYAPGRNYSPYCPSSGTLYEDL